MLWLLTHAYENGRGARGSLDWERWLNEDGDDGEEDNDDGDGDWDGDGDGNVGGDGHG